VTRAALRAAWLRIRAGLETSEPEFVARIDALLEATGGRARAIAERRREQVACMARAVDEESAELKPEHSLNARAAVVQKRIRGRIELARSSEPFPGKPWPYGGLKAVPSPRYIRDRLSRKRAASVLRAHLLHAIVGHVNSIFRERGEHGGRESGEGQRCIDGA